MNAMGKYRFPIMDVSVTDIGVQIVVNNVGDRDLPRKRYTKEDVDFWPWLQTNAYLKTLDVSEISGLKLVAVDVAGKQTQYYYMKEVPSGLADNRRENPKEDCSRDGSNF